jgi:hypothetical protein
LNGNRPPPREKEKKVTMGQALSFPFRLWKTTTTYWSGFYHYLCGTGRYCPYDPFSFRPLQPQEGESLDRSRFKQNARIHLFTLASNFYLYGRPHYRKPSYREDLVDNLRNVAVPGTGIPLSWVACNRAVAGAFLFVGNPAVCLAASVHRWFRSGFRASLAQEYETRLLAPDDWFR